MSRLSGIKVLLGPSTFGVPDPAPLEKLAAAGCQIINNPYKRKIKKNELLELLAGDVSGLIAGLEILDCEVLEKTKLRVISRCGAGISNVDLSAAERLNIKVYSTPDGPTTAVAELTLGAMLSLLRMIPQMNQDLHSGKWTKKIGEQLEGKTVVIVGFGRIGQKVASLLKPFCVRLIVVDPYVKEKIDGVEFFLLDQALPQADIITIHCSGEEQILGRKEFELLKETVFLLNAARGMVVNEEVLIEFLEKGRVAGVWVDTFCDEPYHGPLIKYPNVILTPHVGSYTFEARKSMEMEAVNNLLSAFEKIDNV